MGDLVIVGSCAGTLYAFDRMNGAVRWHYDVQADGNQQFHGDPLVVDGTLIVGTDSGEVVETSHVYAFDIASGGINWMFPVSRAAYTDIPGVADLAIVVTGDDELVALDIATGVPRWTFQDNHDEGLLRSVSPAVRDREVWFASLTRRLFTLDAGSGEVLRQVELGAEPTTSVLVAGDGVFIGTDRPSLVRIDARTSELTGELPLAGMPIGHLRFIDGQVVVLAEEARVLCAVDPVTLAMRWTRSAETGWSSFRPRPYKGWLLVADEDGNLLALEPHSGAEAWRWSFGAAVRGIGAAGSTLYVGTLGGTLTALTVD